MLKVKELLESGQAETVNEASDMADVSRSAYYKYKDYVIEPSELTIGRKAVLSMMLSHERGMLSATLNMLSQHQLNILTITQSLPIHEQANVTLSLDISDLEIPLAQVVDELGKLEGVNQVRLLALE